MSVLNKTISYFPGKTATTQGVEANLLALLQSDRHKEKILKLRQSYEADQKALKEQLPCYTVAGTFSRRCDEGLLKLSGLAAVDLDSAEDYDVIHLLNEFKKIDCIAYAGLSCRGKRLFCIVPFKYPEKYLKHYERLIKSFIDLGLPMGDDCHKRISQPRFISWNDSSTQFFNHTAKAYHLLPPEKKYYYKNAYNPIAGALGTPDIHFQSFIDQINKSYSFTEGSRHEYVMKLARYCNLRGLPEDKTLDGCLQFIQHDFRAPEIKSIVRHIYTKQADSHAKLPFRKKDPPEPLPKSSPTQKESENIKTPPVSFASTAITPPETDFKPLRKEFARLGTITELETFFKSIVLPKQPIKLNRCTTIINIKSFVESHLEIVKHNNANPTFLSYFTRLQELKQYLQTVHIS